MRLLIACAGFLFAGQLSFAGTITHYDIDAQIQPETGELEAEVALTCKAPEGGLQQFQVLLNRSLDVSKVSCDAGVKTFRFDRTQPSPYRYTPTASPLVVEFSNPVEAGKTFIVRLSYQGKIEPDTYHTNEITSDWFELGLYVAWYPVDPDSGSITSKVTVKVDSPYVVTGTGSLAQSGNTWTLTQASPTFDIVVITAPNLHVRRIGEENAGVEVWSKNLGEEQVNQIAGDVGKVMAQFRSWFGPSSDKKLRMVFADRVSGGGYYRPGFMSIIYDNDYRGLLKYAAHEVAHFWWGRGSATTWQDWLNESFAEYSALLFLREFYGADTFAEFLKRYQQQAEKAPAIWGLDRNDKAAPVVLYQKGSVLLGSLEEKIGKDAFRRFLATLVERKVSSTEQLLAALEELTSKPIRDSFEQSLRQ